MKLKPLVVFVSVVIALAGHAQGTAFTYQGRLNDGGNPANGSYDFTFTIFGTNYGGSPITQTITNTSVAVSNGLFTSTLDFGSFLNGNPAWLEIGVRSNGNGGFTILAPRQQLTPTPYAIFANTASNVIGMINGNQIASGTIGSSQLAAGAASANLQAGGQGVVPSGGMLLSTDPNSTNLAAAGYTRVGGQLDLSSWQQLSSYNAPSPRMDQTAVWTGKEMIVWGGTEANSINLNDGGRYDPADNMWSPTSRINAPEGRTEFTAIWTGSKMIIWGGYVYNATNGTYSIGNDGASYDPVTDTWSSISTNNAPSARLRATAVWTGSEMVIWGGDGNGSCYNTGARYDPTTDTWTPMTTNGAPEARTYHSAVWTGTEMIVWGGITLNGNSFTYATNGGCYNPATDTWSPMTTSNMPAARNHQSAVWTGTEMIVWGGGTTNNSNTGGRYNPTTDVWSPTSTIGAPSPRHGQTAVWTGSEMLIWGGTDAAGYSNSGGRYNPVTDSWSEMNSTGAPAGRTGHTAVWTGNEMIVFGGEPTNNVFVNDTFSYTPSDLMYLYQKP